MNSTFRFFGLCQNKGETWEVQSQQNKDPIETIKEVKGANLINLSIVWAIVNQGETWGLNCNFMKNFMQPSNAIRGSWVSECQIFCSNATHDWTIWTWTKVKKQAPKFFSFF